LKAIAIVINRVKRKTDIFFAADNVLKHFFFASQTLKVLKDGECLIITFARKQPMKSFQI
jgi:hypothetical protein